MLLNLGKPFLLSALLSLFAVGNIFASDFFWVENSGAWNDAAHWSSTSGGVGGIGIPTPSDDVFFDTKSFKKKGAVTILTSSYCKNINWNTNKRVTLKSSGNAYLTVNGSFEVNNKFQNEFKETIVFSSNLPLTPLSFNQSTFLGDIIFNGSGSWLLKSNLITTDSNFIFLKQGELVAENVTIFSGGIDATGSQQKTLNLKNAVVYNDKKALFNSTGFSLINLNSDIIIHRNATSVDIGNISNNKITYSSNSKLTNTCGTDAGEVSFTITTTVLTNFNGNGVSCQDSCDAIVYVSITGGVGPFSIVWGSGNPSPGIGDTSYNLCQGNIGVQVTDIGQNAPFGIVCFDQVLVTNPIALSVNLPLLTNPTCIGDCDGAIVTAIGFGTAPYTITWAQVPDLTPNIDSLCALPGGYDINVVDANGCTVTSNFLITEPPPIIFQLDSTNINCFGDCSGTATISNETGGNGSPYFYSWSTGDTIVTSISNLCVGLYSATVWDSLGCFTTQDVNVVEPPQIQLDTVLTHVSCGGACDGSITVTVLSGGVGPFTHFWGFIPPVNGNASTVSNLCAGTYTDSIVDANGCDTVLTFIITEPVPLITSTNTTNVVCFGDCDGTAITIPSGGTFPYTFVWSGPLPFSGQGTGSIFNLCPGQYIVNITDNNNCTVSDTVTITEPPLLVPNATFTNITCLGFNNGTATANPTGGTSPFTYVWTGPLCNPNPGNTQTISSLCPGPYIITVADSAGCIAIDTVVISEPAALNLVMASADESCFGTCDGTATVTVTGGTTPYSSFAWVPDPPTPTGQGTNSISNLCAGLYTVTVTDSVGCTANNAVTVNSAVAIVANLVTSDLSCNSVCNGIATVSPNGGTGPYSVEWDNSGIPLPIPIAGSNTINALCAGPHTALIIDNLGCSLLVNFVITQPPPLTLTTPTTDVTCFGLCDGTATPTPGGGTAPYIIGVNPPTPGPPYNAMCGGIYTFTVTDDSLCTVSDTIQIFAPNEIFPNATFTNITCNGLNDGAATATPTGGQPPYVSIVWILLPAGAPMGNPINNLGPGQYEVTVTDTNGCTGVDTVTIINPPILSLSADATAASCGTVCDGSALATVIGGTPGYTYDIGNGPQTSPIFSNLCTGTYTITVTDTNGCTAQDTTVINPLITININPTIIGISCNGACDGTATVFPLGGTLPYTYLWNVPPPNTDSIVTGLCPGWVTVTVTDAAGCATTDSVEMPVDPSVIQTGGFIVSPISCAGACDGVVTHSPTGGIPGSGYISVWTLPLGIDTNNVCPPYAVITVTDSAGCIASDTLIFTDPTPIVPNDVVVDVLCNGGSTGCITLTPSGGTGGTYTYVWTGPVIGSGSSTCNLPAGIYTITVTDSNGCQVLVVDTINQPPPLSSIPIDIDITCFGLCDGIMAVTANGGLPPYAYTWANSSPPTVNATGDTLFNVCAPFLSNSVTITDANGCQTVANISIIEPTQLLANVTGTPEDCTNPCTGTALSSPTGGTPGYTWQWSANAAPNNLTDSTIINLCPDTFNVTVTDANGCAANGTYIVTAPLSLNVTLASTSVTCNGDNNGTATATILSGSAPFNIIWAGPICNPNPGNTATITNLCPGPYTVTITDSNGCIFIGSVTILEPQPLDDNEVVVPANCGVNDGSICMFPSGGSPPYLHSWSNGVTTPCNTNLAAGFYTDTITDFNGCVAIFTINVTNPIGPAGVSANVNDATCFGTCDGSLNAIVIGGVPPYLWSWTGPGGFTGTDSTETGLCAGTYNLTLTEIGTGCILTTSIVVNEADSITANSSFTDATCNGICDGTASVTPTGGTAPYTFVWSSNGSTASSISGLCIGPASLTITDFNGCTNVVNFIIGSPGALTVGSTTINPTCNGSCNGSATANPVGGTGPYVYQWNDSLAQTTPTATGLCAGTYIVTVTDFNGCAGNDTVVITEPTIIIDNAVTTNSTCGNSDGTASVCASSGGTGIHTYNWPTIGNPSTCSVAGLSAGTYPVEITDANGCMQTFLITISDVGGPVVLVNSTNASCNGVCDGQSTATVTFGNPNYSYLWTTPTSPPQPTTQTITGLCAGNYSVQVTDGNGCITTQPVTITDNLSISATVTTIDATCNLACDGSALVVPNGGVPPYAFSWTGGNAAGQTINAVGGLCAGNYTVTITDALLCSFTQNVVINEPNLLTVVVTGVAANCTGSCDGQATATPTGGTGPFTYLWSTGGTAQTITALCAGTYTVTVTDVNGCTTNGSIIIGDGNTITAVINVIDATCGLCDGAITVAGGGGSGAPFSYSWPNLGLTTSTVSNLCPGAYIVEIMDNAGCVQQFNIIVNNPTGPTLTTLADSVTCFGSCDGLAYTNVTAGNPGYIYQWDDPNLQITDSATALCAGLYNVVVQDALGCVTVDSVTVLEPQQILANATSTPPSCPGVCDGTATITPTGGVGVLTIQWGASAGNQTTPTATALCAGTHLVTITDANGCSIVDSVTLTDPTNISITISSTLPTCAGDCDGTAIANAAGGTPPYAYAWSTVPVSNNSLVGGLCAGIYIVTVTDNNGCTDTASVQVIDPPILTTVSTPNPLTCSGICDGSITTTPAGGVAPYTYIWSNGDTTQTTSNNLCAGTYFVIVVDANNCTVNDTVTLVAAPVLNDNTVISGPSCGICDGSITSTPIGGVGPFDFAWTDPLTGLPLLTDLSVATSTVVGLCAGTVDLQITDQGTGCIYNYTLIINSINGPTLAMTSTDETCVNACDGTATATPTGGTAPYSYSWVPTGPPIITNQTATGLCVGFYTVTVTDTNSCISSDTISINSNGLTLTMTSVVPESCFGACDGSATVGVTGGIPTYIYQWDAAAGNQPTPQATGLCVGLYTVAVTDSALCRDSISTNITGPILLTVTANLNTPISCNANCDGVAIANVVGGTTNYTYAWNDPSNQTTQIATGLCAGTYIVVVTDNNGCTASDTITLSEPTPIVDNVTIVIPACGVCDGSLTVIPTGGTGPYTYLWITPTAPTLTQPITNSIINLCAGAYSVTITDATGCSTTFNYPLSNPGAPTPNTTVTDATCNGVCDGQITSAPTGGTAPYTYFWNPGGDTSQTITGLCALDYILDVTDAAGCVGIAFDTVVEPAVLQANISTLNINCDGVCDGWVVSNAIGGTGPYAYNWTSTPAGQISVGQGTDSISSLCAGTYFVAITDANSCPVTIDSITILEPTLITATSTQVDVTCTANCDGSATVTPANGIGPYTFQWNGNTTPGQSGTQTGLCFGLNTVEIFDQNLCSIIDSINIGATDTVLADAGLDTNICIGSTVNLNGIPSGIFTSVEWFELPGMNSLGTTNSITVIPTATGVFCYAFQVTGACVYSDTVCITVDPSPTADAGPDVTIFDGEGTTLNATGGFTYTWTPSTGLSDTTISNPLTTPTVTTTYYVTVTSANGCSAIDSVVVTVLPNIIFPDGISPNGDGSNDVWIIDFIEQFPNNVVEIYNRWGQLLFHADGYLQNWDGTYNGEELPIGTYYYIIDLHEEGMKPFTGPITVLR